MIPEFLEENLNKQYSADLTNKIIYGYKQKRKVTLRANTLKASAMQIEEALKNAGIEFEKISWSNDAFIILNKEEKDIEILDIYKNGEIYLQSLSSMLPPIILDPKEHTDILDMAAAPGGKITQISALTKNNSNITACELNSIRAERLKYNIEKQGAKAYVMVTDARKIDSFFSFDQILLDAPCSGSGTLNFDSDNSHFTEKLVQKSVKAQKALLKKALTILKPGCEMVYSTCSILQDENEAVVNELVLSNKQYEIVPIYFEGMEDLPLLPSSIPGTLCVMPNELYEGFFIAKIKRIK